MFTLCFDEREVLMETPEIAPSTPRLVWRPHDPKCHLSPFSSAVGPQTQGLRSSQNQAPTPAYLSRFFVAKAELQALAGSVKHL